MRPPSPTARRVRGPHAKRAGVSQRSATSLLALLALAVPLLIVGCSSTSGTSAKRPPQPTVTAVQETATPTPVTALPAFADWRAAYMGPDGQVHAVSLDGARDVAGPLLPELTSYALHLTSAGISPDGHLLAYDGDNITTILDLSGRATVHSDPAGGAYYMFWSPDGREVALNSGEGDVSITQPFSTAPGSQDQLVPGTPGHDLGILLGWVDGSHVAMTMAASATSVTLGVLDVTSGQLRRAATISSPGLGTYHFSLSPNGTQALFFNARYRDQPYTQIVDLISVATGTITPLPHLAQVMGPYSGFTSVAWRRGTSQVAASTGFKGNGDLKGWLLDVSADSASPLPSDFYAMGWAPTGSTLVMSTEVQFTIGWGPWEIDAVAVQANGQYTATVLTRNAMSFPFIGFVRTA